MTTSGPGRRGKIADLAGQTATSTLTCRQRRRVDMVWKALGLAPSASRIARYHRVALDPRPECAGGAHEQDCSYSITRFCRGLHRVVLGLAPPCAGLAG